MLLPVAPLLRAAGRDAGRALEREAEMLLVLELLRADGRDADGREAEEEEPAPCFMTD
jgi:hypothetical protein